MIHFLNHVDDIQKTMERVARYETPASQTGDILLIDMLDNKVENGALGSFKFSLSRYPIGTKHLYLFNSSADTEFCWQHGVVKSFVLTNQNMRKNFKKIFASKEELRALANCNLSGTEYAVNMIGLIFGGEHRIQWTRVGLPDERDEKYLGCYLPGNIPIAEERIFDCNAREKSDPAVLGAFLAPLPSVQFGLGESKLYEERKKFISLEKTLLKDR